MNLIFNFHHRVIFLPSELITFQKSKKHLVIETRKHFNVSFWSWGTELNNNALVLLSLTSVLFTGSCECKDLSILTPRYFIEFDGWYLFPLSSILILPESNFLGDLNIASLVFSTLSEFFLDWTSHWNNSYHTRFELMAIRDPCR